MSATGLPEPITVLRALDAGRMTLTDAIRWAEQQVSSGNELASDNEMLELASLYCSQAQENARLIIELLEKIVVQTGTLKISLDHLRQCRDLYETFISRAEASSVTKDNCVDFILGACPEIAGHIERKRIDFAGHEVGLYNELSAFTHAIVAEVAESKDDALRRSLECLEYLILLGDEYVRGAAKVGVIEGVINVCSNSELSIESLARQLGPRSRVAFDELERFWGTSRAVRFDP